MTKLTFALFLVGAFLLAGFSFGPSVAQKTIPVPAAARQELLKAAKAHGVKINTDKITYVSNQKLTLVRAPIQGSDKYKDIDFVSGAPMTLMIVKANDKLLVPNGSYVVKIHYPPNGLSGKALFNDAAGSVIGQQDLNKPLFPLESFLGSHLDPCSNADFPRIVRVTPGPIPGPGGSSYGFTFPCRDCACAHYYAGLHPKEDPTRPFLSHQHAVGLGKDCLTDPTFVCPRAGP